MRLVRAACAVVVLSVGSSALVACGSDDTEPGQAPATGAPVTEPPHTHPSTVPGQTEAPHDDSGKPDGVVEFGEFARDHTPDPVAYDQTPPVGGPHNPVWQTCGFYDRAFPAERGVHSMEHGAVWITYSPDLPADQVAAIQALADGTREVLAGPFDGLPTPVVASAWGVQLQLESALDPRLAEFADYYENGPQTPELDTPCARGTTEIG